MRCRRQQQQQQQHDRARDPDCGPSRRACRPAVDPAPAAAATCSKYSNQADAQRAKDTRDADGDGIYCEALPCPCLGAGGSSGSGGGPSPIPAAPVEPKPTKPTHVYRHARITSVVDGDTIKVKLRAGDFRTVRLIGIDTPETHKPGGRWSAPPSARPRRCCDSRSQRPRTPTATASGTPKAATDGTSSSGPIRPRPPTTATGGCRPTSPREPVRTWRPSNWPGDGRTWTSSAARSRSSVDSRVGKSERKLEAGRMVCHAAFG